MKKVKIEWIDRKNGRQVRREKQSFDLEFEWECQEQKHPKSGKNKRLKVYQRLEAEDFQKTAMTDKSNEIYEPEALSKIPKKFTYVRNSLNEGWERLQAW